MEQGKSYGSGEDLKATRADAMSFIGESWASAVDSHGISTLTEFRADQGVFHEPGDGHGWSD